MGNQKLTEPKFVPAFLYPKYWGIWIGFLLLRLLAFTPYKAKFALGKILGKLLFLIAPSRRKLAQFNIQKAFPEKSPEEIKKITKNHFESLGISLMETGINLWGKHRKHPDNNESKYFTFHGLHHIEENAGHGILLVVPHFTTIEITGLMLSFVTPFQPIYRKHDNPVMEYIITKSRTVLGTSLNKQFTVKPIPNTETRTMIKELKARQNLMILPDQRYRSKGSIKVPFFGMPAPSNPGISKLAKLGKAKVLPVFTVRKNNCYEVTILRPLENFPSGDDYQDTLQLHRLYEAEIRKNPAQYLWTHNRWDFKQGRDY